MCVFINLKRKIRVQCQSDVLCNCSILIDIPDGLQLVGELTLGPSPTGSSCAKII